MHALTINGTPSKRLLRHGAWLIALVLAVLSWQVAGPTAVALRLSAAAVFAVGTVVPGLLRWPYRALLALLMPLVWLVNRAMPGLIRFSERQLTDLHRRAARKAKGAWSSAARRGARRPFPAP